VIRGRGTSLLRNSLTAILLRRIASSSRLLGRNPVSVSVLAMMHNLRPPLGVQLLRLAGAWTVLSRCFILRLLLERG